MRPTRQRWHHKFIWMLLLSLASPLSFSQKTDQATGFTYTGEIFNDPEWGWSYKTSESDRVMLQRVQTLMETSVKKILDHPGDYILSVSDMSFAFDPKLQETSKANGSKCVTCYFSHSPNHGDHFRYTYDLRMDLIEESESFIKKAGIDDSITSFIKKTTASRRKSANSEEREKQIQDEMMQYQKEIESMDVSKLDEKKLAEIEKKSKEIEDRAKSNEKDQKFGEDTIHAMYGNSYASRCHFVIQTNNAFTASEKNLFTSLRNNPSLYLYKELKIPGCDWAFIYFDRYNRSENMEYSSSPVFIAYLGSIYPGKSSLPKPWVDPFCVRVKFSGNLQQIEEITSKVDFVKLKQILSNR